MKEKILFAEEEMIEQMKELWRECFGDSKDYIEFYCKNRFQKENTLVYCIEKEMISMLTMLPAQIKREGNYIPIRYIYAVGTKKEYRGLGYAGKLLKEAEKTIKEPFLLIPATSSLFSFYESFGFETKFYLSQINRTMDEMKTDKRSLKLISATEYKQIRDKKLEQEGYVRWDEDAVAYALEENRKQQGEAYLIENSDTKEKDILLVREKKTSLDILELSGARENLFSIPEELKNRYSTKQTISFYVPKETFSKEEKFPFKISEIALAMSKGLNLEEGYFNLGLQ